MTHSGNASKDERDKTEVLIVGAGPTGLTLAIELARQEVSFRLIDKDRERATTSRAIGTQARTIEVFQLMGIPANALVPSVRPRAFRLAERERTLARVTLDGPPPGGLGLLSMDESDTERVLERRLQTLGGLTEHGIELTDFRIAGDHVLATLRGPDGESAVQARYLVGTDGANSTVRRRAGIAFIGSAYPERFVLADLDLDWDLPHDEGHIWLGDDGLVAVIPLPGERRYRLIVPLPAADAEIEFPSEEAVAERAEALLRARTGVRLRRIGEPIWASSFRISRRQAERYRQGPVFLAGDAAHVHSPVGGQGMNTGIQDAFNLGWKLALAVKGEAAPGLLDTYEAERHPVAQGVLRGTNIGTRLVLADNPIVRRLRELAVPVVANAAPVRNRLLEAVSQLGVNYRGSFLSVNADARSGRFVRERPGIQAGERVPNAQLLTVPQGESLSLFDLVAHGWLLLLFPGDTSSPEALATLEAIASEAEWIAGEAVQRFVVVGSAPVEDSATRTLLDPSGEVAREFGARGGLIALVRPDGYLGYRGTPEQRGELASYLARAFAVRLSRRERTAEPIGGEG